jgi:hypothetical protein
MLYTYPWWIEHLFYLLSVICVLFLYSEGPLKWADQYKKDVKEYYNKIKELNDILNEDGKFSCVEVWPRFPRPDCFYPWYKMYRMKNTSPSNTSYLLFLFLFFPYLNKWDPHGFLTVTPWFLVISLCEEQTIYTAWFIQVYSNSYASVFLIEVCW